MFRFLPSAVPVVCCISTREQTKYILRCKNVKGCHHKKKSYQFRCNVQKKWRCMFPVLVAVHRPFVFLQRNIDMIV